MARFHRFLLKSAVSETTPIPSRKNRPPPQQAPDALRNSGKRPGMRPPYRVSGGSARPLPQSYGPEAKSRSIGLGEAERGSLNLRETSPRSPIAYFPSSARLTARPWHSGGTMVAWVTLRHSCSRLARGWELGCITVQLWTRGEIPSVVAWGRRRGAG